MSLVETIRDIHRRSERGRCTVCRGAFPCLVINAADEIEHWREQFADRQKVNLKLAQRLAEVEAERDRYLMALSSAQEQGLAFKRQRDEAQQALSALVGQASEAAT